MKKYLLLVGLFLSSQIFAQTGIGTTTPDASAKLDVSSLTQGFLPPRVTLTSVNDITTIKNSAGVSIIPATGLLVYNTGTNPGLAAGYYYWNGNAWATIATAGGSGSFAASFLRGSRTATQSLAVDGIVSFSTVNNTSGQDISLNTSNGKITLAPGNTYRIIAAVPNFSAGQRPAFMWYNETTSSYIGSASSAYNPGDNASLAASGGIAHVIITPSVSTVLSFRMLSSLNSGSVTVGGNADFSVSGSYPWFEVQVISGNTPVTGQTVEYGIARYTGADVGSLSAGALVSFDATAAGNLTWSGNKFTLKANKTYIIEASLAIYAGTPSAARFQIYNYTGSGTSLANGLFISHGGSGTNYPNANTPMKCIVTPTTDIQVGIRLEGSYGAAPGIIGNTSVVGLFASSNVSYFSVQQIGSSAIINPWVLSGTDTYNTTGNVGIGTSAPSSSALLDLSATSKGILIPRMTTAQKNAISTPTTGLLIFQTDAPAGFYYYNGSSWLNISNLGTTNRYIPYSSNFAFYTSGQSLISAASGNNIDLTGSDLEIIVPSGFASNRIVLNWDTWGDLSTTNNAQGSLRYAISQSGTATNAYFSVAMNGWATIATGSMRFATPVSYILNDLAPGTYTFKLRVAREGENGTINSINNYHVAGTGQVYVK